jgi:enamine deaminase RidA (YjgF/YER057c/UK114 family)
MGKQAIGGGFSGPGGMKLPFPKAVRAGDFVFVSGQMATGADGQMVDGGIEVQAREVMDNIKAILAEAGCDSPPARSTVRAQRVLDGKLEVEAIACKPQ